MLWFFLKGGLPRDLQTAAGRQAKTQRQLTAEDIFRNKVDGVNVDDGFIFVGGQAAFFQEAELRGDLMSDLSGALLEKAADMQAMRKEFYALQVDHIVELFGPQDGIAPSEEEIAVSDGK